MCSKAYFQFENFEYTCLSILLLTFTNQARGTFDPNTQNDSLNGTANA